MIICNQLEKKYGNTTIFDNFTYTFKDTGFYLLFGESGCGKTTLLNLLCGLLPFENGTIAYDSLVYTQQVRNEEVGFVHYSTQDSYFVTYLTIGENLKLCCENQEEIDRVLNEFELSDSIQKYPNMLSGGEKQRIAIIMALLQKKQILLLDEPTAALDYENKIKVLNMLNKIKNQVLIICSSHDKEMFLYADHCIEFNKLEEIKEENYDIAVRQRKVEPRRNKSGYKVSHFMSLQNTYPFREKKSKIFLLVVFYIAIISCFFCDTSEKKIKDSIRNTYKLNQLSAEVKDLDFIEKCEENNTVQEVVFDYSSNVPLNRMTEESNGTDNIEEEYYSNISVLPFNKDAFQIADHCLKYGSWFENENDIILGSRLALEISEDPTSLIGTVQKIRLYDKEYEFKVCGIFDNLSETDKKYCKASSITDTELESNIFINGKFMTRYESNENFYLNEKGVRKYMIYYNSFSDMNVDYTKYNKENEKVAIQSFDEIYTELDSMFEGLPIVVYPCIVIILFISILFYFQTKKIELSYSKSNLCVYMYNGYSLKEVLKGYLKYQLIESIKLLASAFAAALVTAVVFNGCNSKFEFLEYQVFTYNGTILVLLFLFVFICTILMTLSLLHTINVHGWYEILKERRDLI